MATGCASPTSLPAGSSSSAGASANRAPVASAAGLRVRAPDLTRPLTETVPAPARPLEPVRTSVLDRINTDRERARLAPVAWDERAARIADAFCARQVEERSRGHFLMDGIPPYARTAFAGVFGVQAENSVSWITTARAFSETPLRLALDGQKQMISEQPPEDGHRQTILDPEATHVGVGWALSGGRFQMAQEFLVRRLERLTLSLADPRFAAVRFQGKPLPGQELRFVVVGREPEPAPLTREEASARTRYSYPPPYLAYLPEGTTLLRVSGVTNDDRIRVHGGRDFSFLFTADRTGLFTLTFYVSSSAEAPRPGAVASLWVERRS